MKNRILIASIVAGASTIASSSAYAHEGDHSVSFMTNVLHWLSSPSHSLFAVIGGVTLAALIIKGARKTRA